MAAGPRKTRTTTEPAAIAAAEAPAVAATETVVEAATEATQTVEAAIPAPVAEVIAEVKKVQEAAKQVAEETSATLEGSFEAATKSLQAFSAKALEAYQNNATASVHYVQALAGVRSVSEAIALLSEHVRQQYETLAAQTKELTALAQQVAIDSSGPLKDQVSKVLKTK